VTKRKEVLEYMDRVLIKVSIKYWIVLMIFGVMLSWVMGLKGYHLLLSLGVLSIASICASFATKYLGTDWYTYYESVYDLQNELLQLTEKIEITHGSDEKLVQIKKSLKRDLMK